MRYAHIHVHMQAERERDRERERERERDKFVSPSWKNPGMKQVFCKEDPDTYGLDISQVIMYSVL